MRKPENTAATTAKELVARGAKLLDDRLPGWRKVMKEHSDFRISDLECCVLGTLEHYHGRLKVMRSKDPKNDDCAYSRAISKLDISGPENGFDIDYITTGIGYAELQKAWEELLKEGE
jgi:hypothetical protein